MLRKNIWLYSIDLKDLYAKKIYTRLYSIELKKKNLYARKNVGLYSIDLKDIYAEKNVWLYWPITNIGLSDLEQYSICLYKHGITPTWYKHYESILLVI